MKRMLGPLLLLLVAVTGRVDGLSLVFVEDYFDGESQGLATIDGLDFAWTTAVSPDGNHVYVCSGVANISAGGADDNAVAVFARAGASGELTFVEVERDDQDGGTADGLFSCRAVAVSPDGDHVYTAGSSENEVGIFARAGGTGALTFLSVVADGAGGVDGLAGAESIAISPDGTALFVAGSAEDAIAAFSRDAGTGALTFEDVEKNGLGGVSGLDRPIAVAMSPDNKHLYAASGSNANFTGSDAISVFAWDPGDGDLTFVDAYFEGDVQGPNTIDGIDQVTDVAVSPDGKHVYAVSEVDEISGASGNGNDWIAVFERNAATGELTWLERIGGFRICTSFFGADAESFVVISADGERVYVTKSWADNGVALFTRNATTGGLTFEDGICELDPDAIGMNLPKGMSLDPTGKHLYVAGTASDAVSVITDNSIFADGFESGNTSAWTATVP